MKNIDDLIEYIETFQNEKDWSNDIWSIKCMAIVVKQNQLEQVSKLPIHLVSESLFPVKQNNTIKEICCNNCKYNGSQMIRQSNCDGCVKDGKLTNHSR